VSIPLLTCSSLDQYIITDGVVVWRAWVLCADQSTTVRIVPVVTLIINFCAPSSFPGLYVRFSLIDHSSLLKRLVFYVTDVGARADEYFSSGKTHQILAQIVNIAQVSMGLSLLTNILATSIIALKAWSVCALKISEWTLCDTRPGDTASHCPKSSATSPLRQAECWLS
jgi:hypothetical protein